MIFFYFNIYARVDVKANASANKSIIYANIFLPIFFAFFFLLIIYTPHFHYTKYLLYFQDVIIYFIGDNI